MPPPRSVAPPTPTPQNLYKLGGECSPIKQIMDSRGSSFNYFINYQKGAMYVWNPRTNSSLRLPENQITSTLRNAFKDELAEMIPYDLGFTSIAHKGYEYTLNKDEKIIRRNQESQKLWCMYSNTLFVDDPSLANKIRYVREQKTMLNAKIKTAITRWTKQQRTASGSRVQNPSRQGQRPSLYLGQPPQHSQLRRWRPHR